MTGRVLAGGAALLAAGLAVLYGVGWFLSRPVPASVGAAPADIHAEDVTFPSGSGSNISGWFSRGVRGNGLVLLLPGIRSNRLAMLERARVLLRAGYSTLLIDFQSTGESPGDAITFGWRERLDVLAAVTAAGRLAPGEQVGIIGVSLGGAATLLAAPELDVQGVVLEAVYPSIDLAVENRLRLRLGSLGAALAPLLLVQLSPRLGVSASDLRPIDRVGQLRCPVLIVGGAVDEHTTVLETQRLFAAAHAPKDLWVVPGAAHVDFMEADPADYRTRILAFMKQTLSRCHIASNCGAHS